MTNVKLKLMFFLLNSLLTADIVHARPYSSPNTTDVDLRFNNYNDTFNIPVDPNADTLIVAHEDETPEETEKSSNTEMEAMLHAEQGRDEAVSNKYMKKHKIERPDEQEETQEDKKTNQHMDDIMTAERDRDAALARKIPKENTLKSLEYSKEDAAAVERQLNISGSSIHLEDLIDAETDREETLTEQLVDSPRFEFLIAARINESDMLNKSAVKSDNNLDKSDRNGSASRRADYVELVEVLKPSKYGENSSAYILANITGHEVDNDLAPDTRFTDLQTLMLACFGTLVPLLGVLFATLFIRCLIRRYCRKPTDSSVSDSSEKPHANHQQLKSPTEEGSAEGEGECPQTNGSIFTMTLKNNHLIVETEERSDITKNGRETKMKYSPDNEGIFVVEVQQSTAYKPTAKPIHNSPPHDPQISTNQALIHRVPEDLEKKIVEEDSERSSQNFERDKALALSSTGLSISDLSMSSIGSHNVSYSYGSQMGYEQGPFGYPVYAGYDVSKDDSTDGMIHDNSQEPLISKTPTDPYRPVVTAAIFKQDSIINNDVLQGPGYCIEGSSDGPLLSDVQAREFSLQHLHDEKEKKLENGVATRILEKKEYTKTPLNRADSLPVRLEEEKIPEPVVDKNIALEAIKEYDCKDSEAPSKESLKGKRASLPIIRADVYETVKDVTTAAGSSKFEKFTNDSSPGEITFDPPPLITITEEINRRGFYYRNQGVYGHQYLMGVKI